MSAKHRLAAARQAATRYPEGSPYSDWRRWITRKVKPKFTWRDPENVHVLYVDNLDVLSWRNCGDSGNILRLSHTGWFADNFQETRITGCVLQLPARNGIEQYVPATYHSDYDTATIYLNEITPEKKDAARWADHNAVREAESSREWEAKEQAQQKIAEAREAIHTINKEVLPALKELKGARLTPALCTMVRTGITELLCDRRSQFATIKKLEDDFWQAVPQ